MSNVLRWDSVRLADYHRRLMLGEPQAVAIAIAGVANAQDVPRPLERDILRACLLAARLHPLTAWAMRTNSGVFNVDGRWVRAGFVGQSDIIGQLKDGRFLAVECKREGVKPTPAQQQFLFTVHRYGGCAFIARSVDDVIRGIR